MDPKVINRGYGFKLEFSLEKADGTAQVVSGTTATWKIAASQAGPVLIERAGITPSTVSGKTIAALALTALETKALVPGQYYHQLAVTLSGGEPEIHFKGWLAVEERL